MLYIKRTDSLFLTHYYLYKDRITDHTRFISLGLAIPTTNRFKGDILYVDSNVLRDLYGLYLEDGAVHLNSEITIIIYNEKDICKRETDTCVIYSEEDEQFKSLIMYLQEQFMLDRKDDSSTSITNYVNDLLLCIALK